MVGRKPQSLTYAGSTLPYLSREVRDLDT